MRRLLPLLLLAPALAQSPAKPDDIIAQENLFWTNYTAGNTAALGLQLTPDFTNVEQKIWNRDQVLAFVKFFFAKCTLSPVTLVSPQVTFITPDIATVVYRATESPTCNGATKSEDVNATTVWVRHDTHWQIHLHTEYGLPPAARP